MLQDSQGTQRAVVKVIQLWDGKRPSIKYLLREFRTYLIDSRLKDENKALRFNNKRKSLPLYFDNKYSLKYLWIETLLRTPISDFRKNAIRLILVPYLVNILRKDHELTLRILTEWLQKCESERKLDFEYWLFWLEL